jgi:hypothetical protein
MFTRITYRKNKTITTTRDRNAMLFGQNLVIDWNFDFGLNERQIRSLLSQVMFIYSNNRYRYSDPYYLHFCNLDQNSISYKLLPKIFQKFFDKDFGVNITNKSYLELFPKQNIIYLTSSAEEVLDSYDYNAVYVMSPLLEKRAEKTKDFVKEKFSEENIKVLRLPFEKHIKIRNDSFICMNQWTDCLNDVKNGHNWKEAFERHIPKSKVIETIDQQYINNISMLFNSTKTTKSVSDFSAFK